jgi:phage I-like protein
MSNPVNRAGHHALPTLVACAAEEGEPVGEDSAFGPSVLLAVQAATAAGAAPTLPTHVQLLPLGTFRGDVDGRGPWTVKDAADVVRASSAAWRGRPLPIDYNHATESTSFEPAPAAGWIEALEARSDGIWGRVEWTPRGSQAIANKEYRFLSPVFAHAKDGTVQFIARAGLTNNPNLLSLQAIAHALPRSSRPSPTSTTEFPVKDELLKKLRALFGIADGVADETLITRCEAAVESEGVVTAMRTKLALASTATAEQIGAALDSRLAVNAAQAVDPTKYVPRAEFDRVNSQLATLSASTDDAAAETDVQALVTARKIAPGSKAHFLAFRKSDKPAFTAMAATLVPMLPDGKATADKPEGGASTLSDDGKAVCKALGIDEATFLKTRAAAYAQ